MADVAEKKTLDPLRDVMVGFLILMGFLGAGEMLALALGLPIPGNVIGMVLLTVALLTGVVELAWVERAADALLSRLGLFFVPPGVGVMLYWDLIRAEWLPLVAALLASTLLVLLGTGWVARLMEKGESS